MLNVKTWTGLGTPRQLVIPCLPVLIPDSRGVKIFHKTERLNVVSLRKNLENKYCSWQFLKEETTQV